MYLHVYSCYVYFRVMFYVYMLLQPDVQVISISAVIFLDILLSTHKVCIVFLLCFMYVLAN